MAAASNDFIKVWNLETKLLVATLSELKNIEKVIIKSDCNILIGGGSKIIIWNLVSFSLITEIDDLNIKTMAISRDC